MDRLIAIVLHCPEVASHHGKVETTEELFIFKDE